MRTRKNSCASLVPKAIVGTQGVERITVDLSGDSLFEWGME